MIWAALLLAGFFAYGVYHARGGYEEGARERQRKRTEGGRGN